MLDSASSRAVLSELRMVSDKDMGTELDGTGWDDEEPETNGACVELPLALTNFGFGGMSSRYMMMIWRFGQYVRVGVVEDSSQRYGEGRKRPGGELCPRLNVHAQLVNSRN